MLKFKNSSHHRGFTIVELLIVIVVIAILATITIVSYNGIQARAEHTKFLAAVDAYEKALRMYELETGGNHGTPGGPAHAVCLGVYPAAGPMAEGVCAQINGVTFIDYGDDGGYSLNDELKRYMEPVANVGNEISFESLGTPIAVRGVYATWRTDANHGYWTIVYMAKSSSLCGKANALEQTDNTPIVWRCELVLK